jgi:gliding motility-associated lipoprotein GldH
MVRFFVFITLSLSVISCNEGEIFNQYKSIEEQLWDKENTVEFKFENTDTVSRKNLFINLRNNNQYPFRTIFLIGKIEFPAGKNLIDTLEYAMTNEYGDFLGSGSTKIKENKLFYKKGVLFEEKGSYKFTIRQATRAIDDIQGLKPLKGITAVGISIEKE